MMSRVRIGLNFFIRWPYSLKKRNAGVHIELDAIALGRKIPAAVDFVADLFDRSRARQLRHCR